MSLSFYASANTAIGGLKNSLLYLVYEERLTMSG